MSLAVLFPGQGSQAIGMLGELGERFEIVQSTFSEAGEVLGYDLWELVQHGPEAALNATEKTQPALLTTGVAIWRLWQALGGRAPGFLAGHSLGEYTALVCAGAIDFGVAIDLVRYRGELMQTAVPAGEGAMAAIIGLDAAAVRRACAQAAAGEIVEAVNFNAPGQIVIAGQRAAVERALEQARGYGARRGIMLPVSVPSHCALMKPAAGKLAARLQDTVISSPRIPVVHNVDAAIHPQPAEIRNVLAAQLYSPVRWVETIEYLIANGVERFIEAGPGKVLAGLGKRISRSHETLAVEDAESLERALAANA